MTTEPRRFMKGKYVPVYTSRLKLNIIGGRNRSTGGESSNGGAYKPVEFTVTPAQSKKSRTERAADLNRQASSDSILSQGSSVWTNETETSDSNYANGNDGTLKNISHFTPEFIMKPQKQFVDEGEKCVIFTTSFEGNPAPEITWQFKDLDIKRDERHKIYQQDDVHYLEILNPKPEDSGSYTATISNSASITMAAADLDVKAKPKPKFKGTPPTFTKELKDITAKEGDRNVVLDCFIKAPYDATVTWMKDGKEIRAGKDHRLLFDGTKAKLTLVKMGPSDAGVYECTVKSRTGKVNCTAMVTLKDTKLKAVAPKFTSTLKDQKLQDGDKLLFEALITGTPEPNVIWSRNGTEIHPSKDIRVSYDGKMARLEIDDVVAEDAGKFACTAKNEAGQDSTTALLDVTEKEIPLSDDKEPPVFTKELENIEMESGDKVELDVQVQGTQPMDIVWVRNNTEIPQNHAHYVQISKANNYKLVIANAKACDAGSYVCEAYNSYGDTDTYCRLVVKDHDSSVGHPSFLAKPKSLTVYEAEESSLLYRISGDPAPTVEWEKDGKVVREGKQTKTSQSGEEYTLSITDTRLKHAGRYTCVATNIHGTVSHTTTLVVMPVHNPGNHSKPGPADDTEGVEQKDFRSVLKGRPLLESIGSQSSTESEKSDNTVPEKDKEVEQHDFRKVLTRHVETNKRPTFTQTLQDQKLKEGDTVIMECEVTGIPLPAISWSIAHKPIKESKYFHMTYEENIACLTIAEAYLEDEGEYECTAGNIAGTATCCCDIYVKEASTEVESSASKSKSSSKKEKPKVLDMKPKEVAVYKGRTFQIEAHFSGEPEPTVRWLKDKKEMKSTDRVKIALKRDSTVLSISDAQKADTGKYILLVDNSIGSAEDFTRVIIGDIPNPPAGKLLVSDIKRTMLTLSWQTPAYDGGSPVTNYRVEMCQTKNRQWKTVTSNCKTTEYQLRNLVPEMECVFRVSAENKYGVSEAGQLSEAIVTSDMPRPTSDSSFDEEAPSPCLSPTEEKENLPFEPHNVEISTERKFEDFYEKKQELGKGKFGSVYSCIEKDTGKTWAAKIIKCREKEKVNIRQEIAILNCLRHPKLLLLWDAFDAPRMMILVTEIVGGGELFERIISDDFMLTEVDCVHFVRQIADGVRYMHDNSILHLDLKPENILCVSPDSNQIKIIDFGLARKYNPSVSTRVLFGTPEFIAPEVINFDEIGFTTDMWSLGVITYVLLSGLSPFLGDNDPETLANVTSGEWDFEDDSFQHISNNAKEFVDKLLQKNKEKRLTVHQALKHRWLIQDLKKVRRQRLNTVNLKHFIARRKWQKMGKAIVALGRMSGLSRGESSTKLIETSSASTNNNNVVESQHKEYMNALKADIGDISDSDAGMNLLFIEALQDTSMIRGDSVTFKVRISGPPQHDVHWYRNDSEIVAGNRHTFQTSDDVDYTLIIKRVTNKDEGEYRCCVSSVAGEISCSANLTVHSL